MSFMFETFVKTSFELVKFCVMELPAKVLSLFNSSFKKNIL